ncbi:MAG TPA: hypothetical protein VFU37_07910 [Pyrinomonadaceae bacterium]|jgi:hypothetical protein|nr:hypothetical protein [Pyrinomonadaceae bacterium]
MDPADDNVEFSDKGASESMRPIYLGGSALGDRCDVCAFFNSREEEYRVLVDVIRTHPMIIIGGILQENPFYVPPQRFLRELSERLGPEKTPTRQYRESGPNERTNW